MSLFRGRPTGKFRSNRLTQVLTIRFFVLFAPKLVYLNTVWDNFTTLKNICVLSIFRKPHVSKMKSKKICLKLDNRAKSSHSVPVKMAPKTVGELRPTHFQQGLPLWKRLVRWPSLFFPLPWIKEWVLVTCGVYHLILNFQYLPLF